MRTASRLGVYTLSVIGAFGLAAALGAVIGPINVGATSSYPVNIPEPSTSIDIDGYTVALSGIQMVGESMLAFDISLDGKSVAIDPILGAADQLAIIRADDLEYFRIYPMTGIGGSSVHFLVEFPTPATYRLFFDFTHAGKVHTAAFTVEISTMAGMSDHPESG